MSAAVVARLDVKRDNRGKWRAVLNGGEDAAPLSGSKTEAVLEADSLANDIVRRGDADVATVYVEGRLRATIDKSGVLATRRNSPIPDGVTDALSSVDWKALKDFPGGPVGFAKYAIDGAARKVGLRKNPALILVHGNPRPPAEVERSWCKFHGREDFTGTLRDVGKIPGAPDYTFALGRCVDVDLGRGPQKFSPMPWLVCDPNDDALWIVAEKGMNLGSGVAGLKVRGVTYAPTASSGKDVANYRHRFESPLPEFCPVGNPNYCRAVMLQGGGYRVAGEEWIYS